MPPEPPRLLGRLLLLRQIAEEHVARLGALRPSDLLVSAALVPVDWLLHQPLVLERLVEKVTELLQAGGATFLSPEARAALYTLLRQTRLAAQLLQERGETPAADALCEAVAAVEEHMDQGEGAPDPPSGAGGAPPPPAAAAGRQQGLLLRDVARRTGLSISQLSTVERGAASGSISALLRLATALGVPLRDLFEETPGGPR